MKCLKCDGFGSIGKNECDACAGTGKTEPFMPETRNNNGGHKHGQDNIGDGE